MKAPTIQLNARLTDEGARPGFLVRIALATPGTATLVYLTNLNDGFSFLPTDIPSDLSLTWVPTDLTLSGISWDGNASGNLKLTLGDPDLVWWKRATAGQLQDAVVDVWLCYAGAPNEAEPIAHAHIGTPKRSPMILDCDLVFEGTLKSSPRRRVQNVIPSQYLFAPGTRLIVGGDTWILARQ